MKAEDAIRIAEHEVGTKEVPANSNNVKYNTWYYGREVHDHDVNSTITYPWCCAFIAWVFRNTGLFPKTASCKNALEWFEQRCQRVKSPMPGDIVFYHFSTNARRTNHVGLVTYVDHATGTITVIEGNTSKTNQDNGGRVMERVRDNRNIVAFCRPKYEV